MMIFILFLCGLVLFWGWAVYWVWTYNDTNAIDAARWRLCRQLICPDDIENGLESYLKFGRAVEERLNIEVDTAMDRAILSIGDF